MPQETHTKPTHAAGMVCCRDFEPFGNCFSTTDYDCAGESTACSRGPVGHMCQSHKGVPCPARADGAHIQGLVCCGCRMEPTLELICPSPPTQLCPRGPAARKLTSSPSPLVRAPEAGAGTAKHGACEG
jgi:hypothetical protein